MSSTSDRNFTTIDDVGAMPPFLMSVLSATDLWMFVASNGGLTAGRNDASRALFPYETVDRLYERPGHGGPYTALRVLRGDRPVLWRPFAFDPADAKTTVSLSKSRWGDRVSFEATHDDLELRMRQRWAPSARFGWVRTVELINEGGSRVSVELIDGLLDVLPAGVELATQQRASNLVDAYRHIDVEAELDLAWYGLSSLIVDRAEPAEALRANVVWGFGLAGVLTVDPHAVPGFLRGDTVEATRALRGRKGAFLQQAALTLEPAEIRSWGQVGDVALDGVGAAALRTELRDTTDRAARLAEDIRVTHLELERLAAAVDGNQYGADEAVTNNHLANTLFNGFRGGVFVDEGRVPGSDFVRFVASRNRPVAERHADWLNELPGRLSVDDLTRQAAAHGDPDLERLALEYLPLAYGRRHGDPSRPWNRFSIQTRTEAGERVLHYEGNWRDIFQNWEALAISFPSYLPSMIAKFVNAMTVDGFNPYRISRDGVDWEVPDPEDPWSNIGYWGDHQLIYLLRLLEALERFDEQRLDEMLHRSCFSFAAVPYRIVPYDEICANPRDTIRFDEAANAEAEARTEAIGHDGRLVSVEGRVAHASLAEKLLIPLLAKISNLVIDGGIWMNTQRPEWNDANNALAGHGLSVVTMAHALRFVRFTRRRLPTDRLRLHAPVAAWLRACRATLDHHRPLLGAPPSPESRRAVLDALGNAYSSFRETVYARWDAREEDVPAAELDGFLELAEAYLRSGTELNRRDDGLFHSYNVLDLDAGRAELHRLPPMLEGQVAALDSGLLSAAEASDLVDALYDSSLHAPDRNSFLLYPDRELPPIFERNRLDAEAVDSIELLAELVAAGRTDLVVKDAEGSYRFSGAPPNAEALEARLDALAADPAWTEQVARDRDDVLALYESTFRHATFTGRSGWMYGFEGLGCIYWHMVAKLAVALVEVHQATPVDDPARARLADAYHRVRSGSSFNKSARAYGAFPTDPYSHTPAHSGAQQPGMTGQVKEQIITRFAELGATVAESTAQFRPHLLPSSELLPSASQWRFVDAAGQSRTVDVPADGLAFTWCGTPIVYRRTDEEVGSVVIVPVVGEPRRIAGAALDAAATQSLLTHDGTLERIEVAVPRAVLRPSRSS